MQVSNGDVWTATTPAGKDPAPLQELLEEHWPVKTAYWLARLARKLQGPRKDADTVRVGLIKEYGTTDEKGQASIKPNDERWEEFVAAYNELMDQTVEIDINRIVMPAKKTDGTDYDYKGSVLLNLEPFVTVEGME